MRTEGQKDMTQLIVVFRNFVKASYKLNWAKWKAIIVAITPVHFPLRMKENLQNPRTQAMFGLCWWVFTQNTRLQ
jgi:hypothetical protein